MIVYLCIKYEFNTAIFSKDNKRKSFFKQKLKKGHNTQNNRAFYIKSNLTCIYDYICMKYESNNFFNIIMKKKNLGMGQMDRKDGCTYGLQL